MCVCLTDMYCMVLFKIFYDSGTFVIVYILFIYFHIFQLNSAFTGNFINSQSSAIFLPGTPVYVQFE